MHIPPPHFVVLPLTQGEKVDGVQKQSTDDRVRRAEEVKMENSKTKCWQ